MNEKMMAYIDSFDTITVLMDKDEKCTDKSFYMVNDSTRYNFIILNSYPEPWDYKFILQGFPFIELNKEYTIYDESGNKCILRSGAVVRSTEFDDRYAYTGPLGVEAKQDETIFRIWTPVAKEIYVEIKKGSILKKIELSYKDKGLWEAKVFENLEGYAYIYHVRVFDEFKVVMDPYALSSTANGEYGLIIDKTKLLGLRENRPSFSGNLCDAIIYETSIRDLSYYLNNNKRGTFAGVCENHPTQTNEPTGIDYVASLGVTHIQLMPIFDFGGVDDIKRDSLYNWGYNPEQYFVPNGWYSTNPNDPYGRIRELQKMVDYCHKKGLRVVMDVVFNHVYKMEEFAFEYLVPGYFYRVGMDGMMTDSSYCGNDLATEKYMCSRFVTDAILYYYEVFGVDGFRFDLMGLLDIDTMKKIGLYFTMKDPSVVLYGEGWNMNNSMPDDKRPHMNNHRKIPEYGFFNDRYRNLIRGAQWGKNPGFIFGGDVSTFDMLHLLTGSCLDYYRFSAPHQSINYVECHDNYTLYDYGKVMGYSEEQIYDAAKLALQIILVSQGAPFIHSGEEFLRTKQGVENSYKSRDEVNMIDYARRDKYLDIVNSVRDLISIRKEYMDFRLKEAEFIKKKTHHLDGLSDKNTLSYLIEGNGYNLYVVLKNSHGEKIIDLENVSMIFDGSHRSQISEKYYVINTPGVYIFKENR